MSATKTNIRPGATSPFLAAQAPTASPGGAAAAAPPQPITPEIPPSSATFAKQTLKFPIDDKQRSVLTAGGNRVIVCCSRQWGKSTTAAIKTLYHSLTRPDCLILIASRTRRQAAELLARIAAFAGRLNLPADRRVKGHEASLQLPNGARIIALSGRPESVRGLSAVSLLVIDEAAFVPDAMYHALRPMLATTGGTIWLLSTPNGRKGFFYETWHSGGSEWERFSVPANECIRIKPEFLEEERRALGPAIFEQEYMCSFTAGAESYFDLEAFEAESEKAATSVNGVFGSRVTRHFIGFDLGQRSSHSAVALVERRLIATADRDPVTFEYLTRTEAHLTQLDEYPLNMVYSDTIARLRNFARRIPNPNDVTLVIDATGCGTPFLEQLRRAGMPCLLHPVQITAAGAPGFSNGLHRVSKPDLMKALQLMLSSPAFKIANGLLLRHKLMEQLDCYRAVAARPGSGRPARIESTRPDDLAMALALAAWPVRRFL